MQTKKRIQDILTDLANVRENLLALSDDIWQSIDHNNTEELNEGVEFKRQFNDKMVGFENLAEEISALVTQFTGSLPESQEPQASSDKKENERIVEELNKEDPHSIDEDFTYKRPYGLLVEAKGYSNLTTWRQLYYYFNEYLSEKYPQKQSQLDQRATLVSSRGNRSFSKDPKDLRYALPIANNLYAEANLSANNIRDNIQKLANEFGINEQDIRIFLREDRNAG